MTGLLFCHACHEGAQAHPILCRELAASKQHGKALPVPVQEPRRCHMTGMLFCHACHEGTQARLPALVLHQWDFSKRPVCALAAQFLASIHEQPLLDVASISPGAACLMPCHSRVICRPAVVMRQHEELRECVCAGSPSV